MQFKHIGKYIGMYSELKLVILVLAASIYVPEQQPLPETVSQVQEKQSKKQLSLQYCGVDVYENGIQTLEANTMINDTIVNILLE